jgi:hypothetical protein
LGDPILKNPSQKRTGGVAQRVQAPVLQKKKKKKKKEGKFNAMTVERMQSQREGVPFPERAVGNC